MPESLTDRILEYLKPAEGSVVHLKDIRVALNIEPGSKDDTNLRTQMTTIMVKRRIVSKIGVGKNDGAYKVVSQVKPVPIFGIERKRRPLFDLIFPRDYDTKREIDFARDIVMREGDVISIGGVKSKSKTTLCLNFTGENVDKRPVLMGNEYTVMTEGEDGVVTHEPSPRFLNRLDFMDVKNGGWINWVDDDGKDKIELLPVRDDFAEHIVKDRINIIDWINLEGDRLFDIGKILEGIKTNLGKGIAIVALQKGEGAGSPRGGQFVRDFSDVEILLDGYGEIDGKFILTIKGVKEKTAPIVGKTYAYTVGTEGTRIIDFHEVAKCPTCYGKGWKKAGITSIPCDICRKSGWVSADDDPSGDFS